jgi:hypothetical protein
MCLRISAHLRPELSRLAEMHTPTTDQASLVPGESPSFTYGKDELLTPAIAAAFLSVNPKTPANWRVKGNGPRFSRAGGIRYKFADLQSYLESRSGHSTAEIPSFVGGAE